MAVNNTTILARGWLEGTNDFQQRIPDPTLHGISATVDALFDPMNRQYYNQFQDYLVNRIAKTVAQGKTFNNPLAVFKKEKINYGSSIQNVAFKWLEAHSYIDDDETLLSMARPDGIAWYVSQNRRDRYDLSISRQELFTACENEYGLNNLIARMLELPSNSDNYDEMNIMINLLAVYENYYGFFKKQLTAAPTDEATGKEFLTQVMADSGMMKFPSTVYNAEEFSAIPTFVTDDEMILIVTPETNASIKVNTYAGLFNLDEARAQARIVEVPFIPIPNAVAILTTRDIFDVHDTLLETDTFWNPQTLTNKYFLHHWGIYGVNPYVPAVLYTTDAASLVPEIELTTSGLSISPTSDTVALGSVTQLTTTLTGTVTPEGTESVEVKPNACTYSIVLTPGEGNTDSALNSRTRVDEYGRLHVQKTGLADGDTLTVTASTTYFNPTGETTRHTATSTLTIG